jgi:hypothetical protein
LTYFEKRGIFLLSRVAFSLSLTGFGEDAGTGDITGSYVTA